MTVSVGGSIVYRTKRCFMLGNAQVALSEQPRPGADRKPSGQTEALLVAAACSSPPKAAPDGRSYPRPRNGSGSPSTTTFLARACAGASKES
jgi:hypothetical protein